MPKTSIVSSRLNPNQQAFIDFRNSPAGRQACIQGSSLAVWEVVWIARGYQDDIEKTASHLRISPLKVKAALNYAKACPDEIEAAIRDHEDCDFESLSRMLPQAEVFAP